MVKRTSNTIKAVAPDMDRGAAFILVEILSIHCLVWVERCSASVFFVSSRSRFSTKASKLACLDITTCHQLPTSMFS